MGGIRPGEVMSMDMDRWLKITPEDEAFYAGVLLSIGAEQKQSVSPEWQSWYEKRNALLMTRCPDLYEQERFLRRERIKYNIWVVRTNGQDKR